jgi:hypothetical protein
MPDCRNTVRGVSIQYIDSVISGVENYLDYFSLFLVYVSNVLCERCFFLSHVPEFIDPVFVKTSPKRSFSIIQKERFGLVFVKTGSIISGNGLYVARSAISGVNSKLT